jgi:hypothetical protein
VEVFCQHDLDAFKVSFRMRKDPAAAPKTMQVATASPTEFIFANLLGRGQWEGDCFRLLAKNGQLVGEMRADAA